MTCTTCTIWQLIIIRGLEAGFLDADRSTPSTQHYSSGTLLEVWIELPAERCHSSLWRWAWKKQGGVSVQHKPCSERWNGTRVAYIATNHLWGALCSGGFWVYSLSTYIHSFLISSWSCWHRNKAAVETLHSLEAPVSTSGWPEDVDLSVFCIINKILLQPTPLLRGWEEWVSNDQLQIIEITSYCK